MPVTDPAAVSYRFASPPEESTHMQLSGAALCRLALLCFGIYSLFLGNIAVDIPLFILSIVLGGVGLSSLFTMISAIASKADNSSVLMAILGFPIILPFLITIIKLSTNAIVGAEWSESYPYMGVLVLLNLIVVTLSYILFPYLWKD